jgi:hypothetical protein
MNSIETSGKSDNLNPFDVSRFSPASAKEEARIAKASSSEKNAGEFTAMHTNPPVPLPNSNRGINTPSEIVGV